MFGNATELIIAFVALKAGLVEIVKASITGTIISNLLLVMGLSMFLGGVRYKEQHKPNLWLWLGVLAISTVAVAFESEIFVGVVEEATKGQGLTPLFTGVILLPLVGGAAEYVTAVSVVPQHEHIYPGARCGTFRPVQAIRTRSGVA